MSYNPAQRRQEAEQVLVKAQAQAAHIIAEAKRHHDLAEARAKASEAALSNARTQARQIVTNATEQAEQIVTAATRHAANIKTTARKYARDHQPAQERPLNPLYHQLLRERYGRPAA